MVFRGLSLLDVNIRQIIYKFNEIPVKTSYFCQSCRSYLADLKMNMKMQVTQNSKSLGKKVGLSFFYFKA